MAVSQSIYEVIEVPLQDGTMVELKPASIALLRKGQKALEALGDVEDADDTLDALINICIVLLKKQRPEWADPENRETVEDLLDLETVYKIIEVFLGVKLNDPKLIEQAIRMQAQIKQTEN